MPAESLAQLRALAADDADLRKYVTYEWHCQACGTSTWVSAAGGDLIKEGACEPHCSSSDLHIYGILAGQRIPCGTAASVCDPTLNP